ncbi:MAG: hypothetical protein P8Y37_13660, partial [Anaerolineales bacterium]
MTQGHLPGDLPHIVLDAHQALFISIRVYDQVGGSPLISAFLAFIILLAASYAAFKLLGLLFYRVADIKSAKKRDQM